MKVQSLVAGGKTQKKNQKANNSTKLGQFYAAFFLLTFLMKIFRIPVCIAT